MTVTEKEKMLAGKPYDAFDAELVAARKRARELYHDFNRTTEEDIEKRRRLLCELFGRCGEKLLVEPPFYCDYGSNIFLGENFYANYGCVILDCAAVKIGKNVKLGPTVQIYTAEHPVELEKRLAGEEYARPITIGDNVWIGGGAIVLAGVTIGNNSVIGAGSVVTRDIPSNVVAAGNPCRVIREL